MYDKKQMTLEIKTDCGFTALAIYVCIHEFVQ